MGRFQSGRLWGQGFFGPFLLACVGCSRGTAPILETSPAVTMSTPAPVLPRSSQGPELAVGAWNDANSRHDIDALARIYAPQVDFYGQHLALKDVIAAKADPFRRAPDFRQELSNITVVQTGDTILATFTKAWTSNGARRSVAASVKLKRETGGFLVTEETDASVTAQSIAPAWQCGTCQKNEGPAPVQAASGVIHPDLVTWFIVITTKNEAHTTVLTDVGGPINLRKSGRWSCSVGGTVGWVAAVLGIGSAFYREMRQLYCADTGGSRLKLGSSVMCNPRGLDSSSDFIAFGSGTDVERVELNCNL